MLIEITGIDGSGKSTLARALFERARQEGVATDLLEVLDPNSAITDLLRDALDGKKDYDDPTMRLLFEAGKQERQAVLRSFPQDTLVFLDRYQFENVAYGAAAGTEAHWIRSLQQEQVPADLTFHLDIDPTSHEWERRMSERGKLDRFENVDYLVKVVDAYHMYYYLYDQPIVPLDATLPLDELVDLCWTVIEEERGNTA